MRNPQSLRGTVKLPVIVLLGVLEDGVGHLRQPATSLDGFQHVGRAEELDAVGRRIAERLEEAGGDECGNRVWRAIQKPRHLFDREPGGQLAAQR